MTYNLRKLLSISTQLSYEACQIIHKTLSDSSYKSFMKGEDDPVTDVFWVWLRLIGKYNLWWLLVSGNIFQTYLSSEKKPSSSKEQFSTTTTNFIKTFSPPIQKSSSNSSFKNHVYG